MLIFLHGLFFDSVHRISIKDVYLQRLLMFFEWKSELGFPVIREYRDAGGFRFASVLSNALIDLSRGQIICNQVLPICVDHLAKQFVAVVEVPPHQSKDLRKK